ncbi:hypothetical protein HanXRQr2_Chr12g0541651 [Helianthus annuus]|uniref:Uncharacterized protein n=1 Tax=Helianthus annuus TaxID=4232 RepID=A0A9K3MWB7_HELAN|nr:hypothetical protein HanXRQr2_Chr12g0541651 [Helianthus annuus]
MFPYQPTTHSTCHSTGSVTVVISLLGPFTHNNVHNTPHTGCNLVITKT